MQQGDFEYEILIHDDASTDGTTKIIQEYELKYPEIIKPIIQTQNQYSQGVRGINFIYNFPRAKGEYIAMCEGDDYWTDPLKLQKQVDFLESNEEVVVCYHDRSVLQFNGEIVKTPFKRFNNLKMTTIIESNKMIDTFMPLLTNMFRTEAIRNDVLLDTRGVFGGDVFLKAFLSTQGKAAYLHFDGAVYRQHDGGVFSTLNVISKKEKAIETRLLILQKINGIDKKAIYFSILKYCGVILKLSLKNGNIYTFLKYVYKTGMYAIKYFIS